MVYFYNFAASSIEGFIICCVLCILRRDYWDLKKIAVIIFALAAMAMLLDKLQIEMNMGFNVLLDAALIKLLYHRKILEAGVDAVCSIMLAVLVEMVTTSLLCYIQPDFFQSRGKTILYLTAIAAAFFAVLKYTGNRCGIWRYYYKYRSGVWILCLNFVFIELAEMYNWNETNTIHASIVVLVSAAVISNLILAVKIMKNQQQREELKKQQELMELKETFLQQMAAEQHDFAKHLRAIRDILGDFGDADQMKTAGSYIEELMDTGKKMRHTIYAGDGILSAILHQKSLEAEEKGIVFSILVKTAVTAFPFSQTEMVELVGNMLDNAFEAVERLEEDRRKVLFEMDERSGIVFVQTINSLPEEKLESEEMVRKGISTKKGHMRGYGLFNVKTIAEKYGGRIEIQQNEEIIVVKILFQ